MVAVHHTFLVEVVVVAVAVHHLFHWVALVVFPVVDQPLLRHASVDTDGVDSYAVDIVDTVVRPPVAVGDSMHVVEVAVDIVLDNPDDRAVVVGVVVVDNCHMQDVEVLAAVPLPVAVHLAVDIVAGIELEASLDLVVSPLVVEAPEDGHGRRMVVVVDLLVVYGVAAVAA